MDYKDSGVDVDKGNQLVKEIAPFVKETKRLGSNPELGGFGGFFDLKPLGYEDPVLVACNDGVGTKLLLAIEHNRHETIGQDLVAMCVNDLIVQGAEPLFFLDYYATGELELDVAKTVIKSIADACKEAECALIGGETAEMPGVYRKGDYDLAGFCVGVVEREHILSKDNIKDGDIILGIKSSGFHSNGYSLIRKIIKDKEIDLMDKLTEDETLLDVLLKPTKIYSKSLLPSIKKGRIKGLAHITGGGLTENIPRALPEGLGAVIKTSNWNFDAITNIIMMLGEIRREEMWKTFNCGIGMVVIVDKENSGVVTRKLQLMGEVVYEIGEVVDEKILGEKIHYSPLKNFKR